MSTGKKYAEGNPVIDQHLFRGGEGEWDTPSLFTLLKVETSAALLAETVAGLTGN